MARKKQKDPLRYTANLTGLSMAVWLFVTALLRYAAGLLLRLFHEGATLADPIAVPEWALSILNLILSAAPAGAALWLMVEALRGSPTRPRLSCRLPRDPKIWLFLPVFLGISFLGNLLTALLQKLLAACTRYTPPAALRLPQGNFALLLYFTGVCAVPAVLEELWMRGAVQAAFSRWGAWFSIIASSVIFALLHGDVAQMPALFFLSVFLGLAAHCTGNPGFGVALHFANNTMSFLFLYASQRMDGISALAFSGYLVAVFGLAAVGCAVLIGRLGVLRQFRPIPRVYDPKNRQSRFERMACAPLFLGMMLVLAVRAVWPLFAG